MEHRTLPTTELSQVRADIARLVAEMETLGQERLTLFAEVQRQEKRAARAEHMAEVMGQCAELMNSSLELDDVLQRVLAVAADFMHAERGFIALRQAGHPLEVTALHNLDRPEYEAAQPVSRSIVERVTSTGAPVVTTDAQADPRFSAEQSIITQQIRSIVCVPLKVRAATIGVVYLDSRVAPNVFSMRDPDLLMAFANLAAPAVENARLFSEERARIREIQSLETLQQRILETVVGGVFTVDRAGRIITMNEAAERIFGCGRRALLHHDLAELHRVLPGIEDFVANTRTAGHDLRTMINTRDQHNVLRVFDLRIAVVDDEIVVVVVNDLSNQQRIEEGLSRYLAPHVVRSLLRNPSELRLGGDRHRATMLFADIRGFTERTARMRPEAVVELLNRYLERAVGIVFKYDGLLDKFYGDGLMAVFGPPLPRDDDAERALRTALALLKATEKLSQELEQPLRISIGLASGTVVAGHIGSSQRMEYTVIGDAVNLASRLEARAEPGTILCDQATYDAAGLALVAESFEAAIRGRDESFTIYRITGAR